MEYDDLCNELGIEMAPPGHDHYRPGWINHDCPYCSKDWSHFRMGYNKRGRYVVCWACGPHSIAPSLSELTGQPIRKILSLLKDVPEGERIEKAPRGKLTLPHGVGELLPVHKKYLRKRGFEWRKIQKWWRISGIGLSADLPWRIFIPIYLNNEMVSWTTRSISDEHSARYISAGPSQESVDHKCILYGEDYARHAIVLCEGPTDVWAIGPGATCSFGTGYSAAQVERIARYPIRVICFDNERFAQDRAEELSRNIQVFGGETYNVRLKGKDAADTMIKFPKEIKELRKRFLE